jgi:acylphosphatase
MTEQLAQVDSPKYWRIFITAASEFDIQGVNLREGICKHLKLPGQVSNIKDGVELIIYGNKIQAEEAKKRVYGICRAIHGSEDVAGLDITLSERLFDFDISSVKVNILRSDDLREMVWGLQGAGRVFQKQLEQKKNQCFISITSIIGYAVDDGSSIALLQNHQIMLREILQETPFDEELTNWLFTFLEKMIDSDRPGLLGLIGALEKETDQSIESKSKDYQELYRKIKLRKVKKGN